MLAQISRVKGTKDEVDLSDYNNLKAFLYFEKVLRYGDNYDEVLQKAPAGLTNGTNFSGDITRIIRLWCTRRPNIRE